MPPTRTKTLILTLLVALASLALPRLLALSKQLAPALKRSFRAQSTMVDAPLKNVVVVGGSYVGLSTANELIAALPAGYRVLVVEKQSHFGHLFAFPRFAVSGGSEHKAFIPYSHSLPAPHRVLRAGVLSLASPTLVQLDREVELDGVTRDTIEAESVVIATGTKLSPPGTMPSEDKGPNVQYFQTLQRKVINAHRIAIIGGGAVGIQMATDIAVIYEGKKEVTLIHSRQQLMPKFHPLLSETVLARFKELGIKTELGSRVVIPEGGFEGATEVVTEDGRKIATDLVIQGTGQSPNSGLIAALAPGSIDRSGFISVHPTMQINPHSSSTPDLSKVFAVGDIAASGAHKAARPAGAQAKVIAANLRSILDGNDEPLKTYTPDPAGIHMTLGVKESVVFRNPPRDERGAFVGQPSMFWKDPDGKLDMGIEGVWKRRAPGLEPGDYHL